MDNILLAYVFCKNTDYQYPNTVILDRNDLTLDNIYIISIILDLHLRGVKCFTIKPLFDNIIVDYCTCGNCEELEKKDDETEKISMEGITEGNTEGMIDCCTENINF